MSVELRVKIAQQKCKIDKLLKTKIGPEWDVAWYINTRLDLQETRMEIIDNELTELLKGRSTSGKKWLEYSVPPLYAPARSVFKALCN